MRDMRDDDHRIHKILSFPRKLERYEGGRNVSPQRRNAAPRALGLSPGLGSAAARVGGAGRVGGPGLDDPMRDQEDIRWRHNRAYWIFDHLNQRWNKNQYTLAL